MEKLKIVFMGTPKFGSTILNELVKEHEVVLVVTQPDKICGRKKEITFSEVKKTALLLNIPIFQPQNIRQEYQYIIENYQFDLIVTAAYGQIVGTKLLYYPKYKAINVHGSLLPKYRGGAPIQRAIINGEESTGITIMYMGKGMDTGDILAQESLMILPTDTADTLFEKMATLGATMINPVIASLVNNQLKAVAQDPSKVTYAYNLTKEDEFIDFMKPAKLVDCQIRGLACNPGGYFKINDLIFKVYFSSFTNKASKKHPGTIVNVTKNSFEVVCGDYLTVLFTEIKPVGKQTMKVLDYLNGQGKNIIYENQTISLER